jgi:hypothetical protein
MTKDARQRERQMPLLDRNVRVADAGSGDLHNYFVGCRRLKVDVGEGERRAHFLHHCR